MSAAAETTGTVTTVPVPLPGREYDILVGRGLIPEAARRRKLFQIDAICLWCTVVHALTLVLFALVIIRQALDPEGG